MEALSYCQLMERMLAAEARVVELTAENVTLKAAINAVNRTAEECELNCDEEKTVLNDLLRHLDKIDIENLSSPWELSSEVVVFVNSRLLREGAE